MGAELSTPVYLAGTKVTRVTQRLPGPRDGDGEGDHRLHETIVLFAEPA